MTHREKAYALLKGRGLEIGALHQPAAIPQDCDIEYCDANTKEEMSQLFPELDSETLVTVDHICDMDKQGLAIINSDNYDFVILNHVIEHVANPIKVLGELFRVVKDNGLVVISAPDKRFTFDKERQLTDYSHLYEEYKNNVDEVTDEHYIDFILGVDPDRYHRINDQEKKELVEHVKSRREHAHVWDSKSFKSFLAQSFTLLKLTPENIYESSGDDNHFEYFSVWSKNKPLSLWSRIVKKITQ